MDLRISPALTEDSHEPFKPRQDRRLIPVYRLAESCRYEIAHAHQVTRLALKLFDQLQEIHGLDSKRRFWLTCAGLLHDIGWVEGGTGHHKTSLRYILNSQHLPWDIRQRLVIGSVARYHRKSLPKPSHEHYAALKAKDQDHVQVLSAILRVADALDNSHRCVVRNVECQISKNQLVIQCQTSRPAEAERYRALEKGDLLESTLKKELEVEWRLL